MGHSSNQFSTARFRIDAHATVAVANAAVALGGLNSIAVRVVPQQLTKSFNRYTPLSEFLLIDLAGPCGGKTTGQSRLCTFFENLGWKVSYQRGDSPVDLRGFRG